MDTRDAFLQTSCEYAGQIVLRVLSRDDAHLSPARFSRAAAKRFAAGLRALEAYLRRLILLLALQMEHDLCDTGETRPIFGHVPRPPRVPLGQRKARAFIIFNRQHDFPDHLGDDWTTQARLSGGPRGDGVPAAPFLARLSMLSDLAKDPRARARRLAWHIARRRPGPILMPDLNRGRVPRRYGTEISASYDADGHAIGEASRARPPPIGAVIRPPPRIRRL
jgi:hypothetical protein